jgi:uncharacterized protein (DUF1330 family)
MAGYWLARSAVTDPEQFQKYADVAPDIIAHHGGRFLAVGGESKILEGSPDYEWFFVIAFPSLGAAEQCYRSAEYQEASRLRNGAGRLEIVIVEGVADA